MTIRSSASPIALSLVVVLVVGGCADKEARSTSGSSTERRLETADVSPTEPYPFTTAAPPLEETPIDGTYSRTIALEDIGGEPVYCRRCAPYRLDPGDYTLRFEEGRFYVSFEPIPTERRCKKCKLPPSFASSGHFTIDDDEIVLFNDTNCTRMTGRYRWKLEADTLTFEVVDDECPYSELRPRFLTSFPWSTT